MNLHGDYSLVIGGPIIGGYCDYVVSVSFIVSISVSVSVSVSFNFSVSVSVSVSLSVSFSVSVSVCQCLCQCTAVFSLLMCPVSRASQWTVKGRVRSQQIYIKVHFAM